MENLVREKGAGDESQRKMNAVRTEPGTKVGDVRAAAEVVIEQAVHAGVVDGRVEVGNVGLEYERRLPVRLGIRFDMATAYPTVTVR